MNELFGSVINFSDTTTTAHASKMISQGEECYGDCCDNCDCYCERYCDDDGDDD